jgi:hypothetical protein
MGDLMTDSPVRDQKAERLAAALRENLKRRKAQARARAAGPQSRADTPDPPALPGREPDQQTRLSDDGT